MNKIINRPDDMVSEMAEGYERMYSSMYKKVNLGSICAITKKNIPEDKVTIVIGGGCGNEPWLMGFVGEGLADAVVLGRVYVAPPAKAILKLTKQIPNNKGVLYIATNHAGDVLNFELVRELAQLEGISTKAAYLCDDLSSSKFDDKENRRGIAGIALFVKILAAAAESGFSLEQLESLAKEINKNISTFSVTTSTGYMPGTNKAMCSLPDGEIEYGMGFNGEMGIIHSDLKPADEIVNTMMDLLVKDLNLSKGQEVSIFLNGFGFTSVLELCIVARRIHEYAEQFGLNIHDQFLDQLLCPQGTGGFSITILKMEDSYKKFYDAQCYSPLYFKKQM